ncbi:hypothetical protein F5X68DRAFT_206927 [Plectosphaerella plurivora]|uniref:Uncharacterized protein n=1 Tax=Plectosphaerella plurivora TaxID=936078 RepID=A0A9P8VA20_9PEZI|nr:hypothetical protein F5X68DRAFT_206927 [Plectosphaerella plurivora]
MSSTGSSLVRARSLRKPTPGSATDLSQKPAPATASSTSTSTIPAASRGLSPSRLPSLRSARPPVTSNAAQTSNVAQPALKKPRPLPGLARSGSVTSRPPPKPQDTAAQAPPPAAASRRYPPNASASASANTAIRRPTSSGGLPPPAQGPPTGARVLGHARAKSTTTASLGAAATSRTIPSAAPVLRPPSQTSATAPKQRPVSIHNRPPSASDRPVPPKPTTATTRTASTTRPPPPPTQPSQDLTRDAPRLRPKPAFSTHQQHFSPLRRPGPKTLTAAYLAPPSPSKLPSNVASSAETARLQTDLLQLHLLHRETAPTTAAWHASARKTLNARHTTLASHSEGLSALEARRAENTDTQALLAWGASHGGLDTSLNALDPLITGLWALHAPAGRCARLARHFSRWCDRLSDAEAARARLSSSPIFEDESALLAGPIDAEWREQAAHLAHRLEGWGRQLRDLRCREDVDANASIRRALEGCNTLVADTLAEIAVMEDIVRLAGARERDWIRRMNREDDGGSARRDDTPRAGAVWRSF